MRVVTILALALIAAAPVLALRQMPRASVSRGYSVKENGGVSLTTAGSSSTISGGYAEIVPQTPGMTPAGLAILSFRQNDILIGETAIPASRAIRSGRIYAEMSDAVDTGLAIANPNDVPVQINFFFSNAAGDLASGSTVIPAKDHAAAFLREASVYKGPAVFQGTFTFTASAPVAAAAIHGFRNERGEFLMSNLPVIDMDALPTGTAILPHFANGGGWTTEILLVNPTDVPISGGVEFRDDSGAMIGSTSAYSIPARSSQKLLSGGLSALRNGSIRFIPMTAAAPVGSALLSYKPATVTVSQTITTANRARSFRMVAEAFGISSESGSANAGLAITNAGSASADVTMELFHLDGSKVGLPSPATFILPANGHTARFLSDFFPNGSFPIRFQGIVRISTTSASGISTAGLRTRTNERQDFLIAATPPIDESAGPDTGPMTFPQFADGDGYTTRFILFSGATGGQPLRGALNVVAPGAGPSPFLIPNIARSSGSIAITADGKLILNVNPDSGSVSAIEGTTERLLTEITVGKDPRCVALSPDDRTVLVTNREDATLSIIDTETLRVRNVIPTDAEPYGVVVSAAGNIAYVASTAQDTVDVIRISGEPAGITSRIAVGPKPRGLAISADGSSLFVTHFLSGEVTVISTLNGRVTKIISTGLDSNMAQKIAIGPGGYRAVLPHLRSNTTNPFLLFDGAVFPTLSVLDLNQDRAVPGERVDLSIGATSVNMPVDVAFSTDGSRLYSVHLGSGDLAVVDLQTHLRIALIDVGDGPGGIVISPDGMKAYVNNSLSDDVSVVDLQTLRETKRIRTTRSPLPPMIQRGKLLFFSSRSPDVSRDRWMSCASCHFDGEHDGRTWMFTAGPRNTTSLRGVADSLPLHWSADRNEVQDFEFTIRTLQAGSGLIPVGEPSPELESPNAGRSADLDALAAYVLSLQVKPSPWTGNVDRGRAVFNRSDVACATCHPAPRYTDSTLNATPYTLHDVGTGDGPGERLGPAFDTPSLRGIWDTPPYLHDGTAPTLRDVLRTRNPTDRHGRTSHLSESEIGDLIAFLKSL